MGDDKHDDLAPVQETVAIGAEDTKHIRDFFTHFNIQMTPTLDKALAAFVAEGGATLGNQQRIKVELAHAMSTIDHPIFKDDLFKDVIGNSVRIVYDAKFSEQLDEKLTPEQQAAQLLK